MCIIYKSFSLYTKGGEASIELGIKTNFLIFECVSFIKFIKSKKFYLGEV